jgi:CheY-like chemotaxis protein
MLHAMNQKKMPSVPSMTSTVRSLRPEAQPKRRVLVVDDDLDAVHSMAMLLKAMGHDVQFAINGLAAIDVARTFRPELILLDIGLPDFKGDEIARQLRWEPGLEKTRIVAMSGRSEDDVRQRALGAGCKDFCVKPLDAAALEAFLVKC